eukprot:196171-Chlamydomonas_euryale.AAC.2
MSWWESVQVSASPWKAVESLEGSGSQWDSVRRSRQGGCGRAGGGGGAGGRAGSASGAGDHAGDDVPFPLALPPPPSHTEVQRNASGGGGEYNVGVLLSETSQLPSPPAPLRPPPIHPTIQFIRTYDGLAHDE